MTAAVVSDSEPTPTAATHPTATDTPVAGTAGPGTVGLPPPATGTRRPHLAPVPDSEPPFDDEVDTGTRAVHGPRSVVPTVQFLGPATTVSGATPNQHTPRSATSTPGVSAWSAEGDIGVVRTATAQLPPVQRAASVLARAVIEVISGHRPVAQLRVHCTPAIYAEFGNRPALAARSLPHLLSVRVCEPADGVAEVSAVYRRADRVRALAFRLQGLDGRWRMTALQLG